MSLLRPEALAQLKRWRETLVGAALCASGLWIAWTSFGLGILGGVLIALLGAALVFTGLRHGFFKADQVAPGLVEVTEGRITYMGPVIGGTIALADLREIDFTRTEDGKAFWRLTGLEPHPLIIPAGANGVDILLDTFTALPQFDTAPMVRAVQSRTATARIIWRHPGHVSPARALT